MPSLSNEPVTSPAQSALPLIEHAVDLRSPLAVAMANGQDEIVELLFRMGASPEAFDSAALDGALISGNIGYVRRLMALGSCPLDLPNFHQHLHRLCVDGRGGQFEAEAVEALFSRNSFWRSADVLVRGGANRLMAAVINDDIDAAYKLSQHGGPSPYEGRHKKAITPMEVAAYLGRRHMLTMLLSSAARPDAGTRVSDILTAIASTGTAEQYKRARSIVSEIGPLPENGHRQDQLAIARFGASALSSRPSLAADITPSSTLRAVSFKQR